MESQDYELLKDSLEKLALNDSSFTYEAETSGALGFGYRCGFLGLLHMNIIQERLEREFELNLISTAPSVKYQLATVKNDGEEFMVENPSDMPEPGEFETISEPVVKISIHVPNEFVGKVIKLCEDRRGRQSELRYITEDRVQVIYFLPLSEMVYDFYDKLKGMTRATLRWIMSSMVMKQGT